MECILVSGDGSGLAPGVSLRGVVGDEATLANKADALVGLPLAELLESLRAGIGTNVVMHGEETVEGVRGGRRVPDLDR